MRRRANLNDLLNDLTFKTLYDKFKLISINAFKWEGLPDDIREEDIERVLFDDGKVMFFRHKRMSHMCLPCDEIGTSVAYGRPLRYRAVGHNFRYEVDADKCVIIENNKLRIPTHSFVMFYVNKLTEAERTMDVNVKSNKTPVILVTDDKDVLSMKKFIADVDGNAPAIIVDKSLNLDGIKALDLKAKFLGKELMDYKQTVEGELLTFLGINNNPVEKKERLITDEANANNELIEKFIDLQFEARERACKKINEMFDLQITVSKRHAVEKSVETVEKDGDDNA